MKQCKYRYPYYLLVTFCLYFLAMPTVAADDTEALKARIESLEKELSQIKDLLKQQVQNAATKEEVNAVKKEVEVAKKEQAEWKTYDSTVHLGGYAQVGYVDSDPTNDLFNQVQYSPIFHYTYKDLILLESELEIEIEGDGGTEVALEYLTIDWFMHDYMALVAGKFLSPVGQFRQNLHPGWINKLPSAPPGFGHDQAAPVADVGAQLRGGVPFGNNMQTNYAFFVTNGPILELNEDGDEIEAVETEGFTEDSDDNKLFGGRIGFLPIPNFELGFSGSVGDIGLPGDPGDRDYDVIGLDFSGRWKNLDLRGEYVKQEVGSLVGSVAEEGQEWEAWYIQPSYKFLPTKFEAVARYSDYDSTHADQDNEQWALGLNYLIAPNAILKFAYEMNDGLAGTTNDENRLFLQFTYGF